VPFLLGGILGPVGLWMRRNIDETPAYTKAKAEPTPVATAQASPWLLAGRAFGFTIVWTVCFYVLLAYMPTYTQKYLKISASAALWANTIGLLALMIFIPIMGAWSDRIGRKPLLLACCVAFIVVPYPIFSFLLSGVSFTQLVLVQIVFAILISTFSGAGPAAIAEIFPTRTRSTWMTSGYALAVAIFGGFAPFISVWLVNHFDSPLAHVFYLIAAAIVSTVVIATLRETAHEELG
jgi:MHS family proline/betaine transporter-like MFS transporter